MVRIIVGHVDGTLEDGNFYGDVGLAPFHDFSGVVPTSLQADLADIAQNLASDSLDPADY